jgi:DNA-directed RNA polymerase specialized sigma24 family protein
VCSIDPEDNRAAALKRLAEIMEDPQTKRCALWLAGHPALADDALHDTYNALARLEHLGQIRNLSAYVYKVLRRAINRQRNQLGADLVADFEHLVDVYQAAAGCRPTTSPSVDDTACTAVQAQVWLDRFTIRRESLRDVVPARSDDPARYRTVICDAAEQVLRDGINGDPSDADSNDTLRAAYPEYFGQPDTPPNTLHQRFRRAREDVKALLQKVVNRDELT